MSVRAVPSSHPFLAGSLSLSHRSPNDPVHGPSPPPSLGALGGRPGHLFAQAPLLGPPLRRPGKRRPAPPSELLTSPQETFGEQSL